VADIVSRRVNDMHATTISMYKSDLKDKILEATKSNQHYLHENKRNITTRSFLVEN
jgi:hypothetical protein